MALRHVHVEVCLRQESCVDYEQLRTAVTEYLLASQSFHSTGSVRLPVTSPLTAHVERIDVTELESKVLSTTEVPKTTAHLSVHVFKLSNEAPAQEIADDHEVATCQQTILPATSLDGLWNSLIFDSAVKQNVLAYAMTAMVFSDLKVNPLVIAWNRVVLLHGPPGTGKTSLCKALAQKLSIRLAYRYPNAVLLEINAHSLFSKWFSESGKLVMKLFRQIQELVEDEDSFVCVLIDEVESLTAARKAAVSGSEPSDAIRVVNALLTQLDALKRYSNVLILTTSNITEAIDVAFVDRADIKQYIGLPSCHARYEILRSCMDELVRVGIVAPTSASLLAYNALMSRQAKRVEYDKTNLPTAVDGDVVLSMELLQCAGKAIDFSGRALRKLPKVILKKKSMALRHVHVEVCLRQESCVDYEQLRTAVTEYLLASQSFHSTGSVRLPVTSPLTAHVERIDVTELESKVLSTTEVPKTTAHLSVHVFKLSNEAPAQEIADDHEVATCQQTILPATSLDGLWNSLIFDSAVKQNVLAYAMTAMVFSDLKVNPLVIAWNRVVLLHGPPGTGKTSLCKALAQKLSIRLAYRYPNAVLLEINAHSLFSKWFSESGKLVMKLFRQIQELVEDEDSFVCVLIDEVESLTAARKAAVSGSEPSDAIRVVNALLTQLDALKRYSNVLILTTSNITEAIDVAFVDRADIKQYIGLPSCHARYEILRSCMDELVRVGIVAPTSASLLAYNALMSRQAKRVEYDKTNLPTAVDGDVVLSMELLQCAGKAIDFSGRALRKLPFQAHAGFAHTRQATVFEFMQHMVHTVEEQIEQRQLL
ncbi:uncharacterized protein CCR75_005999 [Bremia lactucae]|uniref:AAA+ ATPase domain-containing protein n=1 Tax=Bremia lactucae TaxID=4779 RepID=A0A976IG75_BRELC|nr:hypothetical protein CCR75_005999 [Bremia lactucae]